MAAETMVVLLCATVVVAIVVALTRDATVRSDQEELNLIVEKRLHPEILPRDALFGSPIIDLYTPSFIALQTAVARRTGGNPVTALRILVWPFGIVFLAGHYVLFRGVTGSPLASGLGAISALTVRNAPGGEYWGFDGLRAVQPRTVLGGLAPVLLLLFLRWRTRRGFPFYFLGLGALTNVHPVSAFHLAQVTGLGHILVARLRLRPCRDVVVGATLFLAAALPLALLIRAGTTPVADSAALDKVREGLEYRFPYVFYPIGVDTLVSLGIHASLPAGVMVWLVWRRRVGEDLRRLLALAAIAGAVGLGGAAIVQVIGRLTSRPYVDVLQMRATKLAYPVLLAALAVGYAWLLERGSARARIVLVGLFLCSLLPPAVLIHSMSLERRAAIKRTLGVRVPATPPKEAADMLATERLWAWSRTSTRADALFFTDVDDLRVHALRSITGTFKDGGWFYLGGSGPFYDWYVLMKDIDRCRAVQGRGCWFELGCRSNADYVVVDPGVSQASAGADFQPVWAEGKWSVWRRGAASTDAQLSRKSCRVSSAPGGSR